MRRRRDGVMATSPVPRYTLINSDDFGNRLGKMSVAIEYAVDVRSGDF